jgi:hypothetical protein
MQVAFEIHHLADRPGQLADIVARDPDGSGFAETLSSSANGVGLVIGTRVGDAHPQPPGSSGHQPRRLGRAGAGRATGAPRSSVRSGRA